MLGRGKKKKEEEALFIEKKHRKLNMPQKEIMI